MHTPAIVHLVGYPASGKLTVGKALVAATEAIGRPFVLLDNHLTGDVILSVVEPRLNPIPQAVWDHVEQVREVMYRAIVELSPPDWSFVFTNVVRAGDPAEARIVERLAQLAEERSSRHLVVQVRCDPDVVLGRVTASDRRTRHKWTDPAGVARYMEEVEMFEPSDYDSLVIDTSHQPPAQSAATILEHLDRRDAELTP